MHSSDANETGGDPFVQKDRRGPDPSTGAKSVHAEEAPGCDSCGSGKLTRSHVDMAFWSGDRMVLVENVPALVCTTCGEQYTEDRTAMQLDRMRAADFRHATQTGERAVPVFAFPEGRNDAT